MQGHLHPAQRQQWRDLLLGQQQELLPISDATFADVAIPAPSLAAPLVAARVRDDLGAPRARFQRICREAAGATVCAAGRQGDRQGDWRCDYWQGDRQRDWQSAASESSATARPCAAAPTTVPSAAPATPFSSPSSLSSSSSSSCSSLALVPEPGTAAFRDWAVAFASFDSRRSGRCAAGGGAAAGGSGAAERAQMWQAISALAGASAGDLRFADARFRMVSELFAARARSALKRMRVVWAHLLGDGGGGGSSAAGWGHANYANPTHTHAHTLQTPPRIIQEF